jgi:hypothetical protein
MGCSFQALSVHRQVTKSQTGWFSIMLIGASPPDYISYFATSQLSNHSFFGYTNLLQNLRTPLAFLSNNDASRCSGFACFMF